jgi:transcriptional regulator with XRE-family HTH domain
LEIGERLKSERIRLGKSQAELAVATGVAKKSQTNYELGHSAPSAEYLAAAAAAGIDVLYVLTGSHSPQMSGDEAQLLRRYRESSPEVRTAVLGALGIVAIAIPGGVQIGSASQIITAGEVNQREAQFHLSTTKKKRPTGK